jgi:hypothetical protein
LFFDVSEAIFFTTIGLTGATATGAIITQPTALLPVLGLLALAAKVTKLKLANQEEEDEGYGYEQGGYGGYSYGGGQISSGYGHGGGQISGGHGHGGGQISGGHGQGGGHISSGYGYARKGRENKTGRRTQLKKAKTIRHRQKRDAQEVETLEEIFKTINMLVRKMDTNRMKIIEIR